MAQVTEVRGAFDAEAIIRPAVRALPVYTREEPAAGRTPVVRLDWNESPYGPSPKARAALASFDAFHRYPEIDAITLRRALGRYVGAPAERVVVGAGLDDVLNTLAALLIDPGDRVVISEPTFGVYRPLFTLHGADVLDVPLAADFSLDADAVVAAADPRTKLVVVCNPNNPTGNLFPREAVERVIAGVGCLVAIDEAYAEFAGVAHLPLMDRFPNVAVLRTLSKFAGLAGMRVGYGVFPASLMPRLLAVMPAFGNVGAASAAAAIASLDDLDVLDGVVARIVADRDRLASVLRRIPGVEPYPSRTNFLLVRLPVPSSAPVVARLATDGVQVRHFGRPDLVDCLRVTVGTPEENRLFVQALTAALEGTAA
ncbi:MAG: histidinol-phosphate transaminase [Chloroflexota bacterium]|nr:histidinol-phosphate transaminase [Chloroflexota bacterium]